MPPVSSFLDHSAFESRLLEAAAAAPGRIRLEALGETPEGRKIWFATATDFSVGRPEDKPALWLDGNTHAGELASSAFCLFMLETIGATEDPEWLRILRDTTFYVLPRVSPDGADFVVRTGVPVRSVPRAWPEEIPGGFRLADINGDGKVLQIRIPSAAGAWKASARDSRVLVPREPDDREGAFYHLIPEGHFEGAGYDPHHLKVQSAYRADFNRNYPENWNENGSQVSAGTHPLCFPETRTVVDAFLRCPRVAIALTYHTYCGAILRPSSAQADSTLHPVDWAAFHALGEMGTRVTGYPHLSVYESFAREMGESVGGGFDDWAFRQKGVFAFTVELWNVAKAAGLSQENPPAFHFLGRMQEAEVLHVLRWSDEHPEWGGFSNWEPFQHPQLGPVEVGGWDRMRFWQNPPDPLLVPELERNLHFVQLLACSVPRIAISRVEVTALGDELWSLRVHVENRGFLSTGGAREPQRCRKERAIQAFLQMERTQTRIKGGEKQMCDALASVPDCHGGAKMDPVSFSGSEWNRTCAFEWVIGGTGSVTLIVDGALGGRIEQRIELSASPSVPAPWV